MSDYIVGVRVDGDTAGLAKAAQAAKKALESMAVAGAKDLDGIAKASKKTESSLVAMGTRTQREFARMAQARETLGIRSEHRIQQEILRTQAAYQRLASSGTMTWREQRRAADQMRETVGRLNAEMGVYSNRQRAIAGMQRAGLIAAGVTAGIAVVAPKVGRAFQYDEQLAHMANTAYGDASLSATEDRARRLAGRREMDQAIREATAGKGWGTRDEAAATLNTLLSSGRFKASESLTIFREAQRAATANNASGDDFAKIAFSAQETMGIKPEDMARVFGVATYAGQSGPFEVSDMARSLPAQFGFAPQLGLSGISGVAKLAALNQATRLVAGTSDQAATISQNLLAKMGAETTRDNFAKLGIPYAQKIAEGRMRGLDAIDVTADLLEAQLKKDKNYQNALAAYRAAPAGSDRQAALSDVMNVAQGTLISKVFPDMEAQRGMVAVLADRENISKIAKESLLYGAEAVDRNMWTVEESPSFKLNQAKQAAEFANYDAMIKLGPAVSSVADAFSDLARTSPELASAFSGAITVLQGLAVAAGVIGVGGAVMGAGKLAGAGGLARGGWAAGGRAAAGVARAATGAAEVAAGAATAGGLVSGGLLLAAPALGAYTYDQMTGTEGGLRARIADREARIREFDELLAAKRDAGDTATSIGRVQAERDAVAASRDEMTRRLEELLATTKIGGEITVNVTAAPGVQAQTDLRPNDGTKMTGNVGRTNVNTD
ncbi:phage tail tape measure protein [Achromobacter denitrificans]|uniref:Phage tail tape measure protein n=1 Tax=Achromobacter denitrificans TaxID=32002 RepID=A0ABZ3G0Z2_ACHDE